MMGSSERLSRMHPSAHEGMEKSTDSMNRPTPTVDVVICTNRQSPYLASAVDSVVRQTYASWNLIIVDDGSPAEVARSLDALVAPLASGRVIHKTAGGLPAARNTGIAAGSGEFVAFLDDDDVWDCERLERNVSALQSSPSALGTYSGGWYMGPHGERWEGGWSAVPGSRSDFLLGEVPLPRIVALTIRRDAWYVLGGFDPRYSLAEDIDFILRLVARGELVPSPGDLVGYRRHAANMTNAPLARQHRAMEKVVGRLVSLFARRGDARTAAQLRQYRRVYRRHASEQSVGACVAAWRDKDFSRLTVEAAWGLSRNPLAVARVAATRIGARLRSRHSRPSS